MSEGLSREQQQTRAYFDETSRFWHDVYDDPQSFAGYRLRAQHQFALEFVQAEAGIQRILELGCGAGRLAIDLAERGYQVTALDIAPQMIAQAEQTAKMRDVEVAWRVGVVEALTDASQSYDAVIALGLLANIPDLDRALSEIKRVLRPGGHIIVTMPNALALDVFVALPRSLPIMFWNPRFRRWARRTGNLVRRLQGHTLKDPNAIRFGRTCSTLAMRHHLEGHGFDAIQLHGLAFGPMMPLGRATFSDAQTIARSQHLVQVAESRRWLRHFASLTLYTGIKQAGAAHDHS